MALPGVSTGSFRPMALQNQLGRQQKDARDDALRNLLISTGTGAALSAGRTGVSAMLEKSRQDQATRRDATLAEYYNQQNVLGQQQEDRLGEKLGLERTQYEQSRIDAEEAKAAQEITNLLGILDSAYKLEEDPVKQQAILKMMLELAPQGAGVAGQLDAALNPPPETETLGGEAAPAPALGDRVAEAAGVVTALGSGAGTTPAAAYQAARLGLAAWPHVRDFARGVGERVFGGGLAEGARRGVGLAAEAAGARPQTDVVAEARADAEIEAAQTAQRLREMGVSEEVIQMLLRAPVRARPTPPTSDFGRGGTTPPIIAPPIGP